MADKTYIYLSLPYAISIALFVDTTLKYLYFGATYNIGHQNQYVPSKWSSFYLNSRHTPFGQRTKMCAWVYDAGVRLWLYLQYSILCIYNATTGINAYRIEASIPTTFSVCYSQIVYLTFLHAIALYTAGGIHLSLYVYHIYR